MVFADYDKLKKIKQSNLRKFMIDLKQERTKLEIRLSQIEDSIKFILYYHFKHADKQIGAHFGIPPSSIAKWRRVRGFKPNIKSGEVLKEVLERITPVVTETTSPYVPFQEYEERRSKKK